MTQNNKPTSPWVAMLEYALLRIMKNLLLVIVHCLILTINSIVTPTHM